MKSDNAIRNGTSIFVGIIVSIAAFARGALLLPLLLVACSVWGLYVLHHLRGSLPAVPKKKAKAPRRTKFVVPDIEDGPLSDILLLHVNQRITAALRTAGSNITWEWATKDPLAIVKEGGRCLIRVHGLDGFESAEVVLDKQAHLRCELINTVPLRPSPTADAPEKPRIGNIDIAGVTLPILGGLPDIRFESCQITESRMYIKAVNPRLQAEVSPGDIVQAGVIISNSEVGLGSVSIQPLIYRLVCSNGMVVNEAAARRNHVGRVTDSEENFSVYSQATLDAEDKAFVMKIQDTVRAAVEEARFAQVVGKMQEAKAAQMDTHDVPAVVKLASKEFHITDSESTGVLQRLIESNDLTLYGLSNAVTRHSQDVESYDRASELESIGYSILTMPPRQWSRINRAAA